MKTQTFDLNTQRITQEKILPLDNPIPEMKKLKISEKAKKYFVPGNRSEVYHRQGCGSLYGQSSEGFNTLEEIKSRYPAPNSKRRCKNCFK